jgi:hypothetical protein
LAESDSPPIHYDPYTGQPMTYPQTLSSIFSKDFTRLIGKKGFIEKMKAELGGIDSVAKSVQRI